MSDGTLSRRRFLRGAVAAGLGLGLSARGDGLRRAPNIVFVMSDDHAAHAISAYGSRINRTPSIDRIAREGVRFTNCFCTNGICAPSRAVILTGRHSHLNGVRDNRVAFDGSQTTFPKLLQASGWETAYIGKWHLQSDPTGFDWWSILPGQGDYRDPAFLTMGERAKATGYVTDIITDRSLEWLAGRQDSERPFLLMCCHKAPHRNWIPDEKHASLFADADVPLPETLFDDWATRSDAARLQEMTVAHHLTRNDMKGGEPPAGLSERERTEWYYQRYIKDYLRCVQSVDDNVGRLLDGLDAMGLAQDTLVVYTSDQGFFLGDHGWYDKRFMYEESLRMPLLARLPGRIRPNSVCEELVQNLDFAPTFLELAGLAPAAEMQGESMVPLLEGRSPPEWRQSLYYHYFEYPAEHAVRRHYGVRTHRWKLIRFYGDIDAWELYDLATDPHELANLYGDHSVAQVQATLHAELERLRKLYGDEGE